MTQPRYADSPANKLADRIAETFGGKHVVLNRDGEYYESYAEVHLPSGPTGSDVPASIVYVDARGGCGAKANRLTISIGPADTHADVSRRDISFPRATVDATRDVQAIMADIGRRVVNHKDAAPALREYAKRLAEVRARGEGVKAHLAELARFGAYTVDHYPPTNYEGRFFTKFGLDGRVSASGGVWLDRLTLTIPETQELMKLLAKRPAKA